MIGPRNKIISVDFFYKKLKCMFHVWLLKAAGIRLENLIKMCTIIFFEEASNF
jgi:hypothetical protein